MKPARTRFVSILLIVFLTLLLTACNSADSDHQPSDVPSEQEQIPAQEPEIDPNKEVLIYAQTSDSNSTSALSRSVIDNFNRTHDDVQIVVKDYSYTADDQGIDRLITEIAAGQVPDIIDLSGALPYRQMARKGYLEDLWPYIEKDPDLGRDGVLEAPLKAAEVDGKLCMIFGATEIETLVGSADQVGDRTSWSLEELQEAFASMPEGSTLLSLGTGRSRIFGTLLRFSLANYVDWETGTCSFDSPGFRSILEFISLFPDDDAADAEVAAFGDDVLALRQETEERLRAGLQMLEDTNVSVGTLQILDANHGGRCAFIGYPTADGSTGSMFWPDGPRLAISASCKNKEAAWELLQTVLAGPPTYSTPIRKDKYTLKKNTAMHVEAILGFSSETGEAITVPPVTEEQVQRFEAFFNSIDKIDIWERTLFFLVQEAVEPYFAGDKTLDETVRLLNNRVGLYVQEQM